MGPYEVADFEDGGRSRYREFFSRLGPECTNMAIKLVLMLEARGPTLRYPRARHIEGPIWELRDDCDGRALRIYYFQSGNTFYLTCGERKQRNSPNRALIEYAKDCYERHTLKVRNGS